MNEIEKLQIRYRSARGLLVALAFTLLVLAGLLALEIEKEPPRYLVYVDELGIARVIEPLEALDGVEPRFLVAEISRMLINARSLSTDAAVTSRKISSAMAFLSDDLQRFVMAELRAAEPPARRDVEILTVLRLELHNRFLVRWRETTYAESLQDRPRVETWEAYLTVHLAEALDERALLVNPLGLVVTHLDWARVTGAQPE